MVEMIPWFKGFKGEITPKTEDNAFTTHGVYRILDKYHIEVSELPIGVWTQNYKEFLEGLVTGESKSKNKLNVIDTRIIQQRIM